MALVPLFTITQQDGGLTAIATNTTVYGGSNQLRNQAAEYVLWSKTDMNALRAFTNPAEGDVLNNLVYTVSTLVDGWYELIRLRIQPYNAGTAYVSGNIFYYATNGNVYQAITSSTGQTPTNPTYFTQVTDLTTIFGNASIETYYQNFYSEYRTDVCIRDKDDANCACQNSDDDYIDMLYAKKQSADTNFANGNPQIMEKIIRDLTDTCTQC